MRGVTDGPYVLAAASLIFLPLVFLGLGFWVFAGPRAVGHIRSRDEDARRHRRGVIGYRAIADLEGYR